MRQRNKHSRRRNRSIIKASAQTKLICMMADVTIAAADGEGKSGPPQFSVDAYTGGVMNLAGWDRPVVVDLKGMSFAKSLVANLDHDSSKRVGNVTAKEKTESTLTLSGIASAATESAREVVESAANGFVWQASIEATPDVLTEVAAGKQVKVNGQEFTGPLYVASKSTLKGFAFVSHGADDNTTVTIAASAETTKEKIMNPELQAWIEEIGLVAEDLNDEQIEGLAANFNGQQKKQKKVAAGNPFEARKLEAKRREDIRQVADKMIEQRNSSSEEIGIIENMMDHAIDAEMSEKDFRIELYESMVPVGRSIRQSTRSTAPKITTDVLEAAVCQAARLPDADKMFDDRTMQAAHDEFKGRISLRQLLLVAARANGHEQQFSTDVTHDALRAAFSKKPIHAGGFSTLDISTVVANTANKFIMRGWNMVDQTCLRISRIQPVRDFKTITTVSLTDTVIYEKVGSDGQIKHGTLGELTYTNKADTYARMLAITRADIINDDLGALTDAPMKLGNGAMKKLNDIFWTEYLGLVAASFFASGNSNINTGVATMTEAGIDATYVIFKNQTNPDGTPLGSEPAILLVPTALEGAARRHTRSEQYVTGATTLEGSSNIWAGRFQVESSPYISNASYTGYTSVGWWMLGNPQETPVIAIAALNGQVEPTVDTAEADFNTLGVQMRGYSDVGVNEQEYRGGVYADGGSS